MIRICYLNRPGLGAITGTKDFGGGEVQNLNEALELSKDRRFDVHMLVEGDSFRRFCHKSVTVWVKPKVKNVKDFIQTFKLLKEINADIYLERAASRIQMIYEPLICKLLGKKYIYSEIIDPRQVLERPLSSQAKYRLGLTLATGVIANAKHIQEGLRIFTNRRVHMIYVPTIFNKYTSTKRRHILWVGRISAEKQSHIFIELARRLPKEKFLMIIMGELKCAMPPNITVRCKIPHQEMDKYYASAKMLVHTSRSEGFGNVFLEAWRNKTPVVSLTIDPDDVIKKYKTGFHSVTFDQMVKDVKTLLTNKKKWKEFSENGYKYVKENHDIKKIIEQYKELFLNSL